MTLLALKQAVGVAVVGTGSIGMRHLRILSALSDAKPVAVPVRPERVARLRGEGWEAASDLEEAVGRGARLAVIASDTGRHLEDALAALEKGMDLLVEKPLAVDAAQAGRIVEAARARGRQLFVGCVLRFCESLNRFREQAGRIGAIHSVRIECQSYLPDWRPGRPYRDSYSARAGEGGVLRDLIHEIDYAGWIFGWPARVRGEMKNLGRLGIQAEETADLWWEIPGGGILSIRLDYLTRPTRRRMTAMGERGTLEWDGVARAAADEMFLAQGAAVLEAVQGRRDPRLCSGEEGVRALAVCDAVREGAR